jgi:hypothetical protein
MRPQSLNWGLTGLVAVSLQACGDNRISGGTSEHENVLSARAIDTAGRPVAGARAWLRPAGLVADDPIDAGWNVVADSFGVIRIAKPPHSYRLEVAGAGLAALLDGEGTGSPEIRLSRTSPLNACDSRWAGERVRSVGTRHTALADGSGCIQIDSLPQGEYTFVATGMIKKVLVRSGWDLRWTGVDPLTTPLWVPVHFSSTGLSTTEPLSNFSAFDANGSRLLSEHESESRSASLGVLWVRLPSLDSSRSLRILREPRPWEERAFRVDDGWRSVVHFGHADTLAWAGKAISAGAGILGRGVLLLDSTLSRVSLPLLGTKDSGAITFWIRVENLIPQDSVFLELGGARLLYTSTGFRLRFEGEAQPTEFPTTGVLANAAWHHLGIVWTPDSVQFWADGKRRGSGLRPDWSGSWSDSAHFSGFTGALDEWRWCDPRRIDSTTLARELVLQERNTIHFTAVPR